jgi:hypothetical protein
MSNIIFETMIREASDRIEALVESGIEIDAAIDNVAEAMELDHPEVEELRIRNKKSPTPKIVEDDVDEVVEESTASVGNSIFFESADELDQATGILMYKGIPWASKGANESKHSITFESQEALTKAHNALKRRWDFVESNSRKVAVIEFDNLNDYAAVLEFISRKGSMLETYDAGSLDEDFDVSQAALEEEFKTASKAAKELGEAAPVRAVEARSYAARHKDTKLDISEMNINENSAHRAIRVRRKIK